MKKAAEWSLNPGNWDWGKLNPTRYIPSLPSVAAKGTDAGDATAALNDMHGRMQSDLTKERVVQLALATGLGMATVRALAGLANNSVSMATEIGGPKVPKRDIDVRFPVKKKKRGHDAKAASDNGALGTADPYPWYFWPAAGGGALLTGMTAWKLVDKLIKKQREMELEGRIGKARKQFARALGEAAASGDQLEDKAASALDFMADAYDAGILKEANLFTEPWPVTTGVTATLALALALASAGAVYNKKKKNDPEEANLARMREATKMQALNEMPRVHLVPKTAEALVKRAAGGGAATARAARTAANRGLSWFSRLGGRDVFAAKNVLPHAAAAGTGLGVSYLGSKWFTPGIATDAIEKSLQGPMGDKLMTGIANKAVPQLKPMITDVANEAMAKIKPPTFDFGSVMSGLKGQGSPLNWFGKVLMWLALSGGMSGANHGPNPNAV